MSAVSLPEKNADSTSSTMIRKINRPTGAWSLKGLWGLRWLEPEDWRNLEPSVKEADGWPTRGLARPGRRRRGPRMLGFRPETTPNFAESSRCSIN